MNDDPVMLTWKPCIEQSYHTIFHQCMVHASADDAQPLDRMAAALSNLWAITMHGELSHAERLKCKSN